MEKKIEKPPVNLLSGSVTGSFAYLTVKDRLPHILTKVIDALSRQLNSDTYPPKVLKDIISDIAELKYNLTRNRKLPESNHPLWKPSLEEIEVSKRTWFDAPWLLIECYMYELLNQIVSTRCQEIPKKLDIFWDLKVQSFKETLPQMRIISKQSQLIWEANSFNPATLSKLIELIILTNNQADLSLSLEDTSKAINSSKNLVVNDLGKVVDLLMNVNKQITFVLDNSGFELYSDLCLAEYLTKHTTITVILECKNNPWFVSDTTMNDFQFLLESFDVESTELQRQSTQWKAWLDSKRWIIRSNEFWTCPLSFWYLPQQSDLFQSLSQSEVIIFKGDLNYRKMVYDGNWPVTTQFADAIGPLAHSKFPPFVMLRTCKSDTCVGLSANQEHELPALDKDWMVNGKFGLVQLHHNIIPS
ncbi:hypothetical protein BC833DRAFT_529539 [Globomyces pollinis-pini]|nr:hypothetical protein BC833DRAFT_529539 [Globomyces pollinis-pini]